MLNSSILNVNLAGVSSVVMKIQNGGLFGLLLHYFEQKKSVFFVIFACIVTYLVETSITNRIHLFSTRPDFDLKEKKFGVRKCGPAQFFPSTIGRKS